LKSLNGLITLVALAFSLPAFADEPAAPKKVASVEGITEYRLDNGLKILLFPEPSRPKVTVNLTVFVGSRHEGYGEAGMAHLLEHMVFKGTPDHPDVPGVLKERGAQFNGTTWLDRTNYFETLNATDDNAEFAIGLEADRMVHSNIKAEDLATEFSVVRNEFESGENSPSRVLNQRMMAVAYEWHNYGKSTIGNRSDIERVPIDNLRAFYRKYYQPDNALLVVAGKYDEAKVLEAIRKSFGALPKPTRKLDATYTEEPAQDGERSVTLRRVGDVQIFGVMYHIPAGPHPDYPALEVLADALDAAPSGRLYKALVETKKAATVSSSAGGYHDPGMLEIEAEVRKDKPLSDVRDEVLAIVEGIKESDLSKEEVERSKTRLLKNRELGNADPNRVAIELSEWTSQGDWRLYFLHRDRLEKVTPEQIKEAAAKYFRPSNRTLGTFIPTDKADRTPIPSTPDVAKLVEGYKGRDASGAGESFESDPESIQRRIITPDPIGGVKVAILPKKNRGETVNLVLTLHYGDVEGLKGLTTAGSMMPMLMLRGTKSLSRQEIQDQLDKNRARLTLGQATGGLIVRLETQRKYLPAVLDLLRQVLREPTLPADQLEILKTERLAGYEAARSEPQVLASVKLQQALTPYPKDDVRYSPTVEETIDRLKATTIDQVKTIYNDYLGADHGELAVVGDFEPSEVLPFVAKALEGWHSKKAYARIENPYKPVNGERVAITTPDKANATLMAGLTVPMRDEDPDYPAALIGNYVLGGGGLSSRLADRLRQKDGLSYGSGSMFTADAEDENATLRVFAIFNPGNLAKVEAGIKEEFARLLKDGVTPAELEKAQKGYLQQMKIARTSDAGLSATLARYLYLGRTLQFDAYRERNIQALTLEAVNNAVKKYLDPKNMTSIVAGDFKEKDKEKENQRDTPK
jgi:zinc protease